MNRIQAFTHLKQPVNNEHTITIFKGFQSVKVQTLSCKHLVFALHYFVVM